ncbi:hypothetical protein ACLB2K_046384 [Fragaria x ananassa]
MALPIGNPVTRRGTTGLMHRHLGSCDIWTEFWSLRERSHHTRPGTSNPCISGRAYWQLDRVMARGVGRESGRDHLRATAGDAERRTIYNANSRSLKC